MWPQQLGVASFLMQCLPSFLVVASCLWLCPSGGVRMFCLVSAGWRGRERALLLRLCGLQGLLERPLKLAPPSLSLPLPPLLTHCLIVSMFVNLLRASFSQFHPSCGLRQYSTLRECLTYSCQSYCISRMADIVFVKRHGRLAPSTGTVVGIE